MAVVSTKIGSALKLTLKVGIDEQGNDKLSSKTMGKIKVLATDDDIFAVADAISAIKNYPVVAINREDQFDLASM